MYYKITKNENQNSSNHTYYGICPIQKKQAVVTIHIIDKKLCRTDLQKTHIPAGRRCSLLERQWATCLDSCPLVTDKY